MDRYKHRQPNTIQRIKTTTNRPAMINSIISFFRLLNFFELQQSIFALLKTTGKYTILK